MSEWHRMRVEAAALALAGCAADDDVARAGAALHAADSAVFGVVPREDYERLALDYSAMRVRALQDEDLLERALETLDQIADQGRDKHARDLAFATAAELRALLEARRDEDG